MFGNSPWAPLKEFDFLGNYWYCIDRKTYFLKTQFLGAQGVSNGFQSINKGWYEFSRVEKMSKKILKMVIQVKIVNFLKNFQGAPGAPPEQKIFLKMI